MTAFANKEMHLPCRTAAELQKKSAAL